MYKVKNAQGEWIEAEKPAEGEIYRHYTGGGHVESVWSDEPDLPIVVVVNPTTNRILTAVNSDTILTINIQDKAGNVLPITDSFAVPVRRVDGAVERTVGVDFVDGVAEKTINWPSSGEFEITKDLLNMHLSSGQKFDFVKLSISVYE